MQTAALFETVQTGDSLHVPQWASGLHSNADVLLSNHKEAMDEYLKARESQRHYAE
jgi:hypothetical protein